MEQTNESPLTARSEVTDLAGTDRLGRIIGQALAPGDVVGLVGDLGAGKTALTRAIARGAGIPEAVPVNSPTFTILNLYDGPELRICHLDLYRLAEAEELEAIGLADLLDGQTALVIEWFDLFPDAFGADTLTINVKERGVDGRLFECLAQGPCSVELLREVTRVLGS